MKTFGGLRGRIVMFKNAALINNNLEDPGVPVACSSENYSDINSLSSECFFSLQTVKKRTEENKEPWSSFFVMLSSLHRGLSFRRC